MNIKTLNEIVSIVKQKTRPLEYDVSEWNMFVKEKFTTRDHETVLSFIQENEAHTVCHIVVASLIWGVVPDDGIIIVQVNKDGCVDYYGEISNISGVDKTLLLFALNSR